MSLMQLTEKNSSSNGFLLFLGATLISVVFSAFAPLFISHPPVGGPDYDRTHMMYDLVDRDKLPHFMHEEPAYTFFMAAKLKLGRAIGLSYPSMRYVNSLWWGLQVLLVYLVAQALNATPLRSMMIAATFAVHPLGLSLVAVDNRIILSSVFLFAGLLFAIRAHKNANFRLFVASGFTFGMGAFFRSDQIPMPLVVGLAIFLGVSQNSQKPDWTNRTRKGMLAFLLIALGFLSVYLPWKMTQPSHQEMRILSHATTYIHWAGMSLMKNHTMGQAAKKFITYDNKGTGRSWREVCEFHKQYFTADPLMWIFFWIQRLARTWYASFTGEWDKITLMVVTPYLILGFLGLVKIVWDKRFSHLYWFPLVTLLYFWIGATFYLGVSRYVLPVYWVLSFFAIEGLASFAGRNLAQHRR